jgi:hypothetical protein
MVVADFHVKGVAAVPAEAHAELVVHPDAVLAIPVAQELHHSGV